MSRFFRPTSALLILAMTALLAAPLTTVRAADLVNRRGGQPRVAGQVTAMTANEVTVKPTGNDPQTIPVSQITSIEWDDTPSEFRLGLADEANGRLTNALQRFEKVKADGKATNENLKADIDFAIARVNGRAAEADAAQRDAAIAGLTTWSNAHRDHYRYYEALDWLGRLALLKGDMAGARAAFEKIVAASGPETQLKGRAALARVLMAESKFDEATAAFDEIVTAAGENPDMAARKYDAILGKSRALIAQQRYSDALPLLEQAVDKADPNDSALQAEIYLQEGNCLQALKRNKEAVMAYLHVDVLFARETAQHAEALFHLSKLWNDVQLPERAAEARAKLETTYPKSEWIAKLTAAPEQ